MTREKHQNGDSGDSSLNRPKLIGHVSVRITHEEFEVIKKLAANEKDHHMSEVLRRILDTYLEERARQDCSSRLGAGYALR